jgi:transposase
VLRSTSGRNTADDGSAEPDWVVVYYFRLEEQIPTDHLLRMIDDHVDFSLVREQVKDSTIVRDNASEKSVLRSLRPRAR